MRKLVAISLFSIVVYSVYAQITFSGLDLNIENKLLFSVSHKAVTEDTYKSLYIYNLNEKMQQSVSPMKPSNPKLITCYPQSLEVLQNASILQIRNRYGTAHYSVKDKVLKWVSLPDEITSTEGSFIPVLHKRLEPLSVSPNGKWICYIKQSSPASGDLIMKEVATGIQYLLASKIEYSYEDVPVMWSPDSTILTYEKEGNLYFMNLKNQFSVTQIPEVYRQIGVGKINNLFWASSKLLIYVSNEIVYAIPANELYTRALYSDLVGTGRIIGRLPYSFNANDDRYWTSEDGKSIIMVQDNRTLWYMELSGMDFNWVTTLFSYPFVNIPGTALSFDVFWTPIDEKVKDSQQVPLVWIELLRSGKSESYVYMLKKNLVQNNAWFVGQPLPVFVKNPRLSPDKKSLAFLGEHSIHVYDIAGWRQKYFLSDDTIVSYAWVDKDSLYLGGKETVRYWVPEENKVDVLFLSSAENYGWDGLQSTVVAKTATGTYQYDAQKNSWKISKNVLTRQALTQNTKWRVFIDSSPNVNYVNTLYARNLTPMSSNIPLFKATAIKSTYHKPRVAIVFDALDNADGLTGILNSLAKYNLKATFFINGEFLRRFPNAVQEIVAQEHQCGSMFYTPFPLNSSAYKVDETFVRRGLARNEDDFFEATGSELALIWHTPFYYMNDVIKASNDKAGYTYIEQGLAPADTVTLEDAVGGLKKYQATSDIINDLIANLKDGAVIPVSVGLSSGTRSDYLYEKIDLLVSAILALGYDIVPVTELQK